MDQRRVLGEFFDKVPYDVGIFILKYYRYGDLASLAQTNTAWRELIGDLMQKKSFLKQWLALQGDDVEHDCNRSLCEHSHVTEVYDKEKDLYDGLCRLIRETVEPLEVRVQMIKKFMENINDKPNGQRKAHTLIASELLSELEVGDKTDTLKEVASELVNFLWMLNKDYLEEAIPRVIPEVDEYDDNDSFEEDGPSEKVTDAFELSLFLRQLTWISQEESKVEPFLHTAFLKKLIEFLGVDPYPIAVVKVLHLIHAPQKIDSFDACIYKGNYYIMYCGDYFRSVLSQATSEEEVASLANIFVHYMIHWEEQSKAAVMGDDPCLIYLYLYHQHFWTDDIELTAEMFFFLIKDADEDIDDSFKIEVSSEHRDKVFEEYKTALEKAAAHNRKTTFGNVYVASLVREVVQYLEQNHADRNRDDPDYEPFSNRYLTALQNIFLPRKKRSLEK